MAEGSERPADGPTVDTTHAEESSAREAPPTAAVATGTYAIIAEHARGGIGRVYRAEDRRLQRVVAVKELIRDDDEARRRFLREAKLTARLQHPSIAPIYEAGEWPDGRPFYAMKFISGRSLKELIASATTLDARLALIPHVIAIAEAITYAHSQRVIHRDLKPSNVVIGEFGETMVVDWGLGKYLDANADDAPAASSSPDPTQTVEGAVVGTPAFMSPEQAEGKIVDERADVYAIGAILYNLLAGKPPYAAASAAQLLADVVAARATPVDTVEPGVPRDLVAIVDKAMARDRDRRYASAKDLAADLKRFETGQLVGAHSYSRLVLFRRWVRRNRAILTTAALFVVAMIVAGVLSLQRILVEHDAANAERARAETRTQELVLVEARLSLDRDPTSSIAWLKTARIDDASWPEVAAIAAAARARGVAHDVIVADRLGAVGNPVFSADGARVYAPTETSAILAVEVAHPRDVRSITVAEVGIEGITRTADGHVVAPAASGGFVDIDASGAARVLGRAGLPVSIALAPRGREVATCGQSGAEIWDLAAASSRVLDRAECASIAWSPDGALVAATGRDRRTRVFDARSGAARDLAFAAGEHSSLEWSPSGRYVVAVTGDGALRSIELATAKVATLAAMEDTRGLALLPDDRYLAAGRDGTLSLWPLAGGPIELVHGHSAKIESAHLSVGGAQLATCSEDSTARIWSTRTFASRVLRGHVHSVYGCNFSPDGKTVATAGDDSVLRIWPQRDTGERELVGHREDIYGLAFSADGRRIASGDTNGELRVWDVASGTATVLTGHEQTIGDLVFIGDGARLASTSWDGTARLWDVTAGTSIVLPHPARVEGLAVTRDAATIVTGCRDGKVRIWDTAAARTRFVLDGHAGGARYIALSSDGTIIASGGEDGFVRLWDLATGAVLRSIRIAAGKVTTVAFARRGVVAGASDGTLGVWSVDTGEPIATLRGHRAFVRVAVSSDGRRAVSGSDDRSVWLWDLDRGTGVALSGHDDVVRAVGYSLDGRYVASAGQDATVRLWDAHTGRLLDIARADAAIMRLAFSPDGRHVATAGWDRRVHVVAIDPARFVPASPAALRFWLDELTTAVVIAGGRIRSN